MKIAYICADTGIPVLGNKGASVYVREFTDALVELGYESARLNVARRERGAINRAPTPLLLPDDRQELAAALLRLIGDAGLRQILGTRAASPLARRGVSPLFLFLTRYRRRRVRKKGMAGDTPDPGRQASPPAPPKGSGREAYTLHGTQYTKNHLPQVVGI